jgi:hypothetical protein
VSTGLDNRLLAITIDWYDNKSTFALGTHRMAARVEFHRVILHIVERIEFHSTAYVSTTLNNGEFSGP